MISVLGARGAGRRRSAGRALYDSAVRQARAPALYARLGAPDTVEGRFEVLTLHVILLIERLRGEGGAAQASSQALFDTYVGDLDGALREMGVGDLSVGKRMRELGNAFYGRAAGYREAFEALPDEARLQDLIGRTILDGVAAADPVALAGYVTRCRDALRGMTDILADEPAWPTP
jgi:cytochrome b pre-mRNA-processing protein 3